MENKDLILDKPQHLTTMKMITDKMDLDLLSSALRRLATAASEKLGSDCYIHCALAQTILADFDIESRIVVGYAAWRVGNGDSDVIVHTPSPGMVYQHQALPFHA